MAKKKAVEVKTIKKKNWIIEYKVNDDKVVCLYSAFRSKELRGWNDSQAAAR